MSTHSKEKVSAPQRWTPELEEELDQLQSRRAKGQPLFDPELHRMFKLTDICNNWRVHEVMEHVRREKAKEKSQRQKKRPSRKEK